MTFLDALYGSQYNDVLKVGKDGSKGRFNGNIFLAAFGIMIIICFLLILIHIPGFEHILQRSGFMLNFTGKFIGKMLAIPLMAGLYFLLSSTIGNQDHFNTHVNNYLQATDLERDNANKQVLIPFFIVLATVIILAVFIN